MSIQKSEEGEFDPLQIGVSKQELIQKLQDQIEESFQAKKSIEVRDNMITHLSQRIEQMEKTNGTHDSAPLEFKDTNPKDALGIQKTPLSTIPSGVMMELGVAMLEGALKYGRHNYRISGVRASVYYDALGRHLMDWWEGMDVDKDSGLSHIIKAIATLTVLRDAQMCNMMIDDRPPSKLPPDWLLKLNEQVKGLLKKYPNPKIPYVQSGTFAEPKQKPEIVFDRNVDFRGDVLKGD